MFVQAQFVSNLEKHKNDIKTMLMSIKRNNLVSRLGTKFDFNDKISK
jgi:hypothetical protein